MADPILNLVETTLIPILSDIFRGFIADPADYKKPTSHLYTELSTRGVFTVLESGFTTTYKVANIPDSDYQLVLEINRFTFALRIVRQAKFENTTKTNYISFSRDDRIGMYVYGLQYFWISDFWNLLNIACIIFVFVTLVPLFEVNHQNTGLFRILFSFAAMLVWLEVIAFVKDHNGLLYAEKKMEEFQQEALLLLNNYPESAYKEALILMVNYVIERKK
jgi:hypothetical protein